MTSTSQPFCNKMQNAGAMKRHVSDHTKQVNEKNCNLKTTLMQSLSNDEQLRDLNTQPFSYRRQAFYEDELIVILSCLDRNYKGNSLLTSEVIFKVFAARRYLAYWPCTAMSSFLCFAGPKNCIMPQAPFAQQAVPPLVLQSTPHQQNMSW